MKNEILSFKEENSFYQKTIRILQRRILKQNIKDENGISTKKNL